MEAATTDGEGDGGQPTHDAALEDLTDCTEVPAFDGATRGTAVVRQRTNTLQAAAASIAVHALAIVVGVWAVSAGRLSLPAEGSGGENGEMGLADAAELALHRDRTSAERPTLPPEDSAATSFATTTTPPQALAQDQPPAFEPLLDAAAFADRARESLSEATPAESPPLIGLGPGDIPLPRFKPKAPQPAQQVVAAAAAGEQSGTSPAVALPEPSQTVASGATTGAAPSAPSGKADAADGVTGAAVAQFRPARPLGLAGGGGNPGGKRGRRGGSGLDGRGLPIPEYPPGSRRRGEQGLVVLEVEVREDGTVGAVRVTESSGHPRLDEAAADAVRRAAFTPAMLGGRAVAGVLLVPYRFRLD